MILILLENDSRISTVKVLTKPSKAQTLFTLTVQSQSKKNQNI